MTPRKREVEETNYLTTLVSSRFNTKSYFNQSARIKREEEVRIEREKQMSMKIERMEKLITSPEWETPKKGDAKELRH